ncbi:MAG TPA: tol-pal system protein YbgF [Burkholderiales bacterium]|nr:tol-pal system protein YbgF [Burkholderiales bacterium]
MKRRGLHLIHGRGLMAALLFALMPAHAAIFDDDEARKQIAVERARVDDALKQLDAISERLGKVEDQLKSGGLLDLQSQIEQLRQDLAALRGQIEVLNNNIEGAAKRQRDMYLDLDTRLRRLEQPAAMPSAAASANTGEDQAYDAAKNQFDIGNYPAAITAFQDFRKQYPDSERAPRAQYWIGNAYYSARDFKSAIDSQRALIKTYPYSDSVPDAMLNIASSQIELGDLKAAKKVLRELIDKYPLSAAADKARRRLPALGAKK